MIDYRKLTTKDKCLSSVASYVEFESSYRQDIYWIQICQKCHMSYNHKCFHCFPAVTVTTTGSAIKSSYY